MSTEEKYLLFRQDGKEGRRLRGIVAAYRMHQTLSAEARAAAARRFGTIPSVLLWLMNISLGLTIAAFVDALVTTTKVDLYLLQALGLIAAAGAVVVLAWMQLHNPPKVVADYQREVRRGHIVESAGYVLSLWQELLHARPDRTELTAWSRYDELRFTLLRNLLNDRSMRSMLDALYAITDGTLSASRELGLIQHIKERVMYALADLAKERMNERTTPAQL